MDLVDFSPELINMLNSMNSEPIVRGATDGDYQIPNGQGIIRQVPPASGTLTITLPGVMAAKNQSILVISIGNDTGTITVEEKGDGIRAWADVILTIDLDYVVVKNIAGLFWVTENVQAT